MVGPVRPATLAHAFDTVRAIAFREVLSERHLAKGCNIIAGLIEGRYIVERFKLKGFFD